MSSHVMSTNARDIRGVGDIVVCDPQLGKYITPKNPPRVDSYVSADYLVSPDYSSRVESTIIIFNLLSINIISCEDYQLTLLVVKRHYFQLLFE